MTASLTVRGLELSAANPAVIVPVTSTCLDDVATGAAQAVAAGAHLVEWRVDSLLDASQGAVPDTEAVIRTARDLGESVLKGPHGRIPLLLTVRTTAEGGQGPHDSTYQELLEALMEASVADLVDVECRRESAPALIQTARRLNTPVVASFHDFKTTPSAEQIERILREQETLGAAVAKVAVMPDSAADVATLLLATARRSAHAKIPLITMSMAGQGAVSRIAGHVFGSCATFGVVGQASAPGQIPFEELTRLMDGVNRVSGQL